MNIFFKVVCIDENNPFEYQVLLDKNFNSINNALDFIRNNYCEYNQNVKWVILSYFFR